MAGIARPISSEGGLIDAYAAQIKTLQGDPNATEAYKKQLDQWMDQVKAATDQTGSPAAPPEAAASTNPIPPVPATVDGPPPSAADPDPVPQTSKVTALSPPDATAPSSSAVLSGPNVPEALKALAPAIESASRMTGVPVSELAAVIWDESRGVLAASSTNPGNGLSDSGVMQINPDTFGQLQSDHPELQGKSLADPATNILAGAYFLSDLHQQFGTWDLAQRAYNSGPLSVDRNDPNYIRNVDGFRETLERGGTLPA